MEVKHSIQYVQFFYSFDQARPAQVRSSPVQSSSVQSGSRPYHRKKIVTFYFCYSLQEEREKERERETERKKEETDTHTHTHTQKDRKGDILLYPFSIAFACGFAGNSEPSKVLPF